jgi:Zn-dependent protease with chaperone function
MTIGGSLLLIAAGAILKWAVTAKVSGFDINTAGTVLFIVGLAGLVVSLVYTFWWTQQRERSTSNDPTRTMTPPPSRRDPRY